MQRTRGRFSTAPTRLHQLAAGLAVLAQLVLVFAPVIEGREGVGAPSHVEASGTATHYAHEEALCVACQARTFHGLAPRAMPALRQTAGPCSTPADAPGGVPAPDGFSPNLARAPPPMM